VELSKIKNIIIIILLIVNIFFLVLFIIGRIETGKLEKKAKEDVIRILSSYGISLDMSVIPVYSDLGSYDVQRDTESERSVAEAVLGKCQVYEPGGNIYQYSSPLGEAVFRGNGEFSITIAAGIAMPDSSLKALGSYLDQLDITADLKSAEIKYDDGGSLSSVQFTPLFEDVGIFNCRITMSFNGESLMSIHGRRLTSLPSPSPSEPMIGVNTALISFLNAVRESDLICNEIITITPGYSFSASVSGSGRLAPYWCITTDVGKYYVNGLTGDMVSFPD
jgi:hypothetical protein